MNRTENSLLYESHHENQNCFRQSCACVCVTEGERERLREKTRPSNSPVKPSTPISSHGQSLTQHTHLHRGWWDPPWALPCDWSSSTTVCASPLRSYFNTEVGLGGGGGVVWMIYIHLWYIGNLRGANQWYSLLCFPLNSRRIRHFCMAIIGGGDTSSSFRCPCSWIGCFNISC